MSKNNLASEATGSLSSETSIYVIDDHATLLRLIVGHLNGIPSLKVIGQASSAEAALADDSRADADLILTDLSMPGMNGIELAKVLSEEKENVPLIVLTAHSEQSMASKAFEAGACAYVTKDDPSILEGIITRVLKGERNISVLT